VTRWRSYALYHNRGGGRFEDVTAPAARAGDRDWPMSGAFAHLDGDGDLDVRHHPAKLRLWHSKASPPTATASAPG
jgi:hypothetical protein